MKLKEFRNMVHMSQKELGDKLGVSDVTIGRYERGEVSPSVETLKRMADIFNVSVDALVGHDSKLLDMSLLTNTQRRVVHEVMNVLSGEDVSRLCGYVDCLKEEKSKNQQNN